MSSSSISTNILIATTYSCGMAGLTLPLTVTLKSSAATRKIEFSTDGGIEYFSPSIDVSSATMLVTHTLIPLTNIKVTGIANDTLILVG
jgi:hypothetical protein